MLAPLLIEKRVIGQTFDQLEPDRGHRAFLDPAIVLVLTAGFELHLVGHASRAKGQNQKRSETCPSAAVLRVGLGPRRHATWQIRFGSIVPP